MSKLNQWRLMMALVLMAVVLAGVAGYQFGYQACMDDLKELIQEDGSSDPY